MDKGFLTNLSAADRCVRLLVGVACAVASLSGLVGGMPGAALLLFAWVPIVTGIAGWCPFYTLLGISSRRR
jgi:hypothetical protein